MKKLEDYTEDASALTKSLFAILHLLTVPPRMGAVEKGLKTFDEQVKKIREHIALSLLDQPTTLESVAKIDQHWRQSIIDSIYDLKNSEFEHLLSEPNLFFSLYLQQDVFPEDGLDRLMNFFIGGFSKEVADLKISLKELITDKADLNAMLDKVAEIALGGKADALPGCLDCIVYLKGFFNKDILVYFERLEKCNDPDKNDFVKKCRSEIVKASKSQFSLFV